MKGQFKHYTAKRLNTQGREVPLRLIMGLIYLAIGFILYLCAN